MNTLLMSRIIEYEDGALDFDGIVDLFAELVKSGLAWQLQGAYGRTARRFIESGIIDTNGNINTDKVEEYHG